MDKKIAGKIEQNIKGLQSNNDKVRSKHFDFLYPLSDSNPELLYPYWNLFVEMLRKPEVSNKYYAIHLLANLIRVDKENRFEEIFDFWFNDLLNFESPVVSPHIAEKSGLIVKARPELEERVTPILLNITNTSKCRHLDLQKVYVLSALDIYFDTITDKSKVTNFIKEQLNSRSSKTRKKAQELVKKYKLN